jgi:hypothetical protein
MPIGLAEWEAERPGGVQIERQFELCRLLDRQIGQKASFITPVPGALAK